MPSATLQALTEAPTLVPPNYLTDPASAEAWLNSLPPQAQAKFKARLTLIVQALPPVAQLDLRRFLANVGASMPVPVGIDGIDGLGQGLGVGEGTDWGALIVGVIGAGAGLYNAAQTAHAQQQIANNAASSSLSMQNALLAAQTQTNAAVIQAQKEAAVAADVLRTQRAATYGPALKWGGISLGLLALVGGGLYLARRTAASRAFHR